MLQPQTLDEVVNKFRTALHQHRTILRFGKELPHLFRSSLVLHAQRLDRR
jgi:hypothetical protein